MKTVITITGEHYGRSGEVVWPDSFPTPVEGQPVELRDGTTVYVRTVVYYPQGDEDRPEPFVYVVLGPRRPVGEPDDFNRQFAGPSGAAHPWAHIYDQP